MQNGWTRSRRITSAPFPFGLTPDLFKRWSIRLDVVWTYRLLGCLLVASVAFEPVSISAGASSRRQAAAGNVARPQLFVQLGHGPYPRIQAAAFANDASFVVTGGKDGLACLWSTDSGQQIRTLMPVTEPSAVRAIAVSPDSSIVLTGYLDGTCRSWNAATGLQLASIRHDTPVVAAAVLPDSRTALSASEDGNIRIWSLASGELLSVLDEGGIYLSSMQLLAGGTFLVTGGRFANVWELRARSAPRRLQGIEDCYVTASGNGDVVAFRTRGAVSVFDVASWQRTRTIDAPDPREDGVFTRDMVTALCPDGRELYFEGENSCFHCDLGTEAPPRAVDSELGFSSAVAFSNDHRFAIAADGYQAPHLLDFIRAQVVSLRSRSAMVELLEVSPGLLATCFGTDDSRHDRLGPPMPDLIMPSLVLLGVKESIEALESPACDRARRLWLTPRPFENARRPLQGKQRIWDLSTGRAGPVLDGSVSSWKLSRTRDPMVKPPERVFPVGDELYSLRVGRNLQWLSVLTSSEVRPPWQGPDPVETLLTSPDGSLVVINQAQVRAVLSGDRAGRLVVDPSREFLEAIAPSNRAALLLPQAGDRVRLVSLQTGRQIWSTLLSTSSPRDDDGATTPAIVGKPEEPSYVYAPLNTPGGNPIRAVISSDGKYVAVGCRDGTVRLLDASSGRRVNELRASGEVATLRFSPDGKYLVWSSYAERAAIITDVSSFSEIARLPHPSSVQFADFTHDGKYVCSSSSDGMVRLFDVASKQELLRLVTLDDGTWLVADSEGRFDTNNLERIEGVHWTMPDDPFISLPIEVFSRDYYEPGLLRRVLAGEQMPAVRNISDLNRATPVVAFPDNGIVPEPNAPGTVAVTVTVSPPKRLAGSAAHPAYRATDAYDVRLFRDGHIVGVASRNGPASSTGSNGISSDDLGIWRDATRLDLSKGSVTVQFRNVQLPATSPTGKVEFSAYAFNDDRVRCSTARTSHDLKGSTTVARSRAYVISIGVNSTENGTWTLRYAAGDARAFAADVSASLDGTGRFEAVVPIALVSDDTETTATKANIAAVFDLLAGRSVESSRLDALPSAARSLSKARPGDLILISISSHGYKATGGDFYIVPYDIGVTAQLINGKLPDEVLSRCVSATELALWLNDVDADSMALALDTCYSGAFAGEAFKPGPMGARGLGQLAYDKGMRVLASTQGDSVAVGPGSLRSGLLLYALREDGLRKGRADTTGDGTVGLSEWFTFASWRVPQIFVKVAGVKRPEDLPDEFRPLVAVSSNAVSDRGLPQKPVLFDFSKSSLDPEIRRAP